MALSLTPRQRTEIVGIARRWGIETFELFGSAVTDRFGPASDVDLLVAFGPETRRSLFDLAAMEEELEAVVARPVDLVTRRAVERSANPIRRAAILSSARSLYSRAG